MANANIQLTIQQLSAPLDLKVRRTREDFLDLLEAITFRDPGKMFDHHGNPLEIPHMPFAERMSMEGFKRSRLDLTLICLSPSSLLHYIVMTINSSRGRAYGLGI